MTDYQNSTHKARWIFEPAVLAERREAANARAVNRFRQYGAFNFDVEPTTLCLREPEEKVLPNGKENPQQPLTVREEALICRSYEVRIQQTCASLKFPHVVQATAIIFFKRFYLKWSVMDFPPACIMFTCIHLAVKAENHQLSLMDIALHLEQKVKVVGKYEILVLKTIELDIAVYTPYLSCDGFYFDMEDFFVEVDATHLKGLRDAKQYIDKLILTDVPLLYNPGQIALAALHKANEQHKLVDFDRYLERVCSIRRDLSVEILKAACRQIISHLENDELEAEADTTRDVEERLNINDSNVGFPSLLDSVDIDSKLEEEERKMFSSNEAHEEEKEEWKMFSSRWKNISRRLFDDDDGRTENTTRTPDFGGKRFKTVQ